MSSAILLIYIYSDNQSLFYNSTVDSYIYYRSRQCCIVSEERKSRINHALFNNECIPEYVDGFRILLLFGNEDTSRLVSRDTMM